MGVVLQCLVCSVKIKVPFTGGFYILVLWSEQFSSFSLSFLPCLPFFGVLKSIVDSSPGEAVSVFGFIPLGAVTCMVDLSVWYFDDVLNVLQRA